MTAVDGDLRKLFRTHIVAHWISVESGSTSGGIPDSNFCAGGIEGWIEYKQTHAWAVSFRPTQVALIWNRCLAGGRVWIAVRRWKRKDGDDQLWLVPGRCVRELARDGLRGLPVVSWDGGPRGWNWDDVRRTLLGST